MAIYSTNHVVKTLTLHKPGCRVIPWNKLKPCGCGDRGEKGNQRWYCEEHIRLEEVDAFMNKKHWATLFCDLCYHEA